MKSNDSERLAFQLTRAASKQTYYTIRLLVDRDLVPGAFRAYAYFRWLDDCLDANTGCALDREALLNRQQLLLDACYRREKPESGCAEEQMLIDLVSNDIEEDSGLQSYLRNMMAVMAFDVERRGRMISQVELAAYSQLLATAVTDALHFFIGHNCPSPHTETRYLAVQGAHIVHMLRDLLEDADTGYFNIPLETIKAGDFRFQEIDHPSCRQWVHGRVDTARVYFSKGREYLVRVKNFRCRLAGFAYLARFEWMASQIEKDGYRLRMDYPERKSLRAALWMFAKVSTSLFGLHRLNSKAKEQVIPTI